MVSSTFLDLIFLLVSGSVSSMYMRGLLPHKICFLARKWGMAWAKGCNCLTETKLPKYVHTLYQLDLFSAFFPAQEKM